MKQTQKSATSLITKQLIKAKRGRADGMMKMLYLVYLHHEMKQKLRCKLWLNAQESTARAQRKAHAKGNCDNIFYVSS